MVKPIRPHEFPDAADLGFQQLVRALGRVLNRAVGRYSLVGAGAEGVWMPNSWLSAARYRADVRLGRDHESGDRWSRRRQLVALGNALDLDVAALLACGPWVECQAVYDALLALEAEWAHAGDVEVPTHCGHRPQHHHASSAHGDVTDHGRVWIHHCWYCGATQREVAEGWDVTRPSEV